ncbi:MAG: methionine adenosyltransferase [Paenibacillaceae bacterium]|nr:methionine adenosyltransferase [Paenibacillaceae bacterium]
MGKRRLFTSESVTEGHPDKVCDQVSDAVLDAFLANDPNARVACEVMVTTGLVLVAGEISTRSEYVDIPSIVRRTIRDIGYTNAAYGFDYKTCAVLTSLDEQSADIAMGVDTALEARGDLDGAHIDAIGAGDQGLMFGYACDETPERMPLAISLAHQLSRRLAFVRREGILDYLRPDGKTQVTVEYEDDRPVRVDTVVVSTQHAEDVSLERIQRDVQEHVIDAIVAPQWRDGALKTLINPTGRFVIGGPHGDAGLTGRKIIVDTYGGAARHGGGAFSGKDPTKVDRSGAYAARYVATNIVAAGLARRCEVQVAYAIGVASPVSIAIDTFGTGVVGEDVLERLVRAHFDLRPAGMIRMLDLRRPMYARVAAYGHFGRTDVALPWERTDKADILRTEALGVPVS